MNASRNYKNIDTIFKLSKKTLDKASEENENLEKPTRLEELDKYTKITNSIILNVIRKNLKV